MEQGDLLRYVINALDRLGVPYMLVGSLASTLYGEPRMTQDIDIVVQLNEQQIVSFCQAFPPSEFYVSETAALEAIRRGGQFNVIHPASGNKIDILLPLSSPWVQSELSRRHRKQLLPGLEGFCARPEDVIIGKMAYYREGGSEKHLRDIAGIMKVSGDEIDRQYIADWALQLGLTDIWTAILNRTASAP